MPDRRRAESILQKLGHPFDHRADAIVVHSDELHASGVADLRQAGWRIQEVGPRRITLEPTGTGLSGVGL